VRAIRRRLDPLDFQDLSFPAADLMTRRESNNIVDDYLKRPGETETIKRAGVERAKKR
jgi:hypothetical protein